MAKPIKETPVLRGRDAKKFLEIRDNSKAGRLVDAKTSDRMKANFEKINSLAKSR